MIHTLLTQLINKKKVFVIEYRWKIDKIDTLWVVYKKYKNKLERDKEYDSLLKKNCEYDFTEFIKKTIVI